MPWTRIARVKKKPTDLDDWKKKLDSKEIFELERWRNVICSMITQRWQQQSSLRSHAINDYQQSVRNHTLQKYKNTGNTPLYWREKKTHARTTIKIIASVKSKTENKTKNNKSYKLFCTQAHTLSNCHPLLRPKQIRYRIELFQATAYSIWKVSGESEKALFRRTSRHLFTVFFSGKRPKLLQYFKLMAWTKKNCQQFHE